MASKPGGLNIKESLQPRELFRTDVAVRIYCGVPSRSRRDEGRCLLGRNGYRHQEDRRGMGASNRGKIRGITLGKTYFQQRRAATCKDSWYKGKTEAVRGFRPGA